MTSLREYPGRLGLTATILVLTAACPGCPSTPEQTTTVVDEDRPECPHTWNWEEETVMIDRTLQPLTLLVPGGQLSGPGPIQDVPEYHDCQRFVAPDNPTQYGELYAIFASYDTSTVVALADSDTLEHVSLTGQAAEIVAGGGTVAVPAVEIFAKGEYEPLHIGPGLNCLVLFRENSGWAAKMVYFGAKEGNCREPMDASTIPDSRRLEVLETKYAWATLEDYPKVARWDWDDNLNTDVPAAYSMRIGVGASELAVGSRGFRPEPPRLIQLVTGDPRVDRTFAMEAMYDEQDLAVLPTGAGAVQPTQFVGIVRPHPELGGYTEDDFRNTQWLVAAYVYLPHAPQGYAEKFGFKDTPQIGDFNTISLCHGPRDQCLPPGAEVERCDSEAEGVDPADVEMWWARILGPSGTMSDARYRCVIYRRVEGINIPGTVRWRWLADDEGGWMRCPQGCCELS